MMDGPQKAADEEHGPAAEEAGAGGTIIPSIEGPSKIRVQFTAPPLVPGEYALDIGFYDGTGSPLDEIYGAAALRVL
jgi:hypothetical protein